MRRSAGSQSTRAARRIPFAAKSRRGGAARPACPDRPARRAGEAALSCNRRRPAAGARAGAEADAGAGAGAGARALVFRRLRLRSGFVVGPGQACGC